MFCEPEKFFDSVEVLGHYDDIPGKPAAIILCKVGKGKAVLSGVHFEYGCSVVENRKSLNPEIVSRLCQDEKKRLQCFQKIMEILGL